MAPPRSAAAPPRLADIDPQQLALDVCLAVLGRTEDLAKLLEFKLHPRVGAAGERPLRAVVAALAAYAQLGETPAWNNMGETLLDASRLLGCLYGDVASRMVVPNLMLDDEPRLIVSGAGVDAAIATVLTGVRGRVHLHDHDPLSVREVAVLAGLSVGQVRVLGSAGRLRIGNGRVAWADACRELRGRGVPGVGAPARVASAP